MERNLFEKCIVQAVKEIPLEIRSKIVNVAFVVEDDQRAARSAEKQIKARGVLLGLYQGIPLLRRSAYYSGSLPDKITLFKNSIERLAGQDMRKIKQLIREVVHHEIGHYLGMNERQVRAWERQRQQG